MSKPHRGLVWIAGIVMIAWGARGVWADQSNAPPSPSDHREDAAEKTEAAPATQAAEPAVPEAAPSQDAMVSVDFKDADVRQVLRIISLKSGVDIVAGPDVEGTVTIKLTNVPWEQALDIILRTYGLTYERKGNIIRVMTLEAVEQEALSNEVFTLNYARAKEVGDIVKEMISDRGKVKFDERTNTVIVTDLPSTLFQLKTVIQRLDQQTPQVHIESRFVETRLTRDENLGIDWFDTIQPSITPAIVPTTFPYGTRTALGSIVGPFVPRAGTFSPSTGASLNGGKVPSEGGLFTFGTINMAQLSTTINMLKQRVDTHVISNPTIVTLNNKEATVQVGTDVNIPNFQIDPSTGRATVTGLSTRSTGIILKVTPHVNLQQEIVMDVRPEITTVGADRTFGGGITFPDFDVQKAETQVRLVNGETLAIGGLKRQANRVTSSKIPILGDIPILGRLLFENKRTQTPSGQDQLDLLIFMTVHLVQNSPATAAVASKPVTP